MTVTIGRRELLAGLGGAAAWPLAALAQQPVLPTVGFLRDRSLGGVPQRPDRHPLACGRCRAHSQIRRIGRARARRHPDGGHWKQGAAAAGNSCCAGPRAPSPGSELVPWGRVLSE